MKKTLLFLFGLSVSILTFSQKSQIDLPITWNDTANVDYSTIDFGGDTSYLAADPTSASNIVLEVIKTSGAMVWAGVVLGNDSLATAIPFSAGNTVMRARIYSPAAGVAMRMKVEDETNGTIAVETEVMTTVVGWDTLSFDFSNQVSGTPAINFANTYDKIAVFFNFGVSPTIPETYYIDYTEFTGGGSAGPTKASIDLPINWDDTANVDYTVIDFGGNISSMDVDPSNAANLVLKSEKTTTSMTWAGTTFGNSLGTAIPFSVGNTTIRARVYAPVTGVEIRMKVEDQTDPTKSVESVATTVVVGWDTLDFDMAVQASGTAVIDYNYTYDKLSMFYNFGVMPAANQIYYTDDVWFGSMSAMKSQIDLPITWDDSSNVDYTVVDFGGNASMLAADPTNATNTVLQSDKIAGAMVWGGTSLGNALASAIPFAVGNTTMKAIVYSPTVGISVKLKVEDSTDPTKSVETDVTTTVVGWDTLTFDFSTQSPMTAAINFATTYDKASIFYNFGVSPTVTETYYVDDVYFDVPPAKRDIALPVTWDDSTNIDYTTVDFGGNSSMLVADPTNAVNTVLQSDKTAGAMVWGGTSFGNGLATAIPFSAGNTTISARVYSPAIGVVVKLKAEDQTNGSLSVETDVTTTQIGWDTLIFDMSNNSANTPAINFATTYDKLSIFYNFGVSPTVTETYYVDDVVFGSFTTGLNNVVLNKTFNVYPNPANGFVIIESENLSGINQLIITNSLGQVVIEETINGTSNNRIDVTNLENGIYFMILNSESGMSTSKFLVAR